VELPTAAPATLELLDIGGPRLCIRDVGGSPGVHAVTLMPARNVGAGVYFVRLVQGRELVARRVSLVE
jgi:hypothetical protein